MITQLKFKQTRSCAKLFLAQATCLSHIVTTYLVAGLELGFFNNTTHEHELQFVLELVFTQIMSCWARWLGWPHRRTEARYYSMWAFCCHLASFPLFRHDKMNLHHLVPRSHVLSWGHCFISSSDVALMDWFVDIPSRMLMTVSRMGSSYLQWCRQNLFSVYHLNHYDIRWNQQHKV